jgi:hypothetical protein
MSKAQAARTSGVRVTSIKRYAKLAKQGKPLSLGKASAKKGKLHESAVRSCLSRIYTPTQPSPRKEGAIYSPSCSGLGYI